VDGLGKVLTRAWVQHMQVISSRIAELNWNMIAVRLEALVGELHACSGTYSKRRAALSEQRRSVHVPR
jgi:hypothetical protein